MLRVWHVTSLQDFIIEVNFVVFELHVQLLVAVSLVHLLAYSKVPVLETTILTRSAHAGHSSCRRV